MKGSKVLKVPAKGAAQAYQYGDMLFDLQDDPEQKVPMQDEAIEARLKGCMKELMKANEAPEEQYERLGYDLELS